MQVFLQRMLGMLPVPGLHAVDQAAPAGGVAEGVCVRARERFSDHALGVDCVGELTSYKRPVLECGKELWRRDHPDYERLPKGFEERLVLRFSEVAEGSAVVPLRRVVVQEQPALDFDDEFNHADLGDAGGTRRVGAEGSVGCRTCRPWKAPGPLPLRQQRGQVMRTVFADADYWIGLFNPRDDLHSMAVRSSQALGLARIVTSEMVLGEVLAAAVCAKH